MTSERSLNLQKSQTWPQMKERAIRFALFSCAAMSIVTTIAIIAVLVTGAIEFFTPVPPTVKMAAALTAADSKLPVSPKGPGEAVQILAGVTPETTEIRLSGHGEYKHPLQLLIARKSGDAPDAVTLNAPVADGSNRWTMTLLRDESVKATTGSVAFVEKVDAKEGADEQAVKPSEPQKVQLPTGDLRVAVNDPRTTRNLEFFYGTEWYPLSGKPKYGVLPLIWDTIMVAGIAALFGLPMGLAISIYLSEYATPRARAIVKPVLEVLAGIPTIVYGFFALTFITPLILQPVFMDMLGIHVGRFNALSAGLVVGIMIIPMVSSLSEDVLRAVPRGLREAGYALGSTRLDVSLRVVVPAALSGIIAAFLLAISRAIGETMAVTLAAGMSPNLTLNVFESVQTMTAFIVNITSGDVEVGSAAEKSLYAVGLTLFLMTLVMNILSQMVLRRFREVYQ